MTEKNYLERLAKYDSFLNKKIENCNTSFSKFLGKTFTKKDPAIEEALERIIDLNQSKLELYKNFPELIDYLKQKGE